MMERTKENPKASFESDRFAWDRGGYGLSVAELSVGLSAYLYLFTPPPAKGGICLQGLGGLAAAR